jgi:hypothetical protein
VCLAFRAMSPNSETFVVSMEKLPLVANPYAQTARSSCQRSPRRSDERETRAVDSADCLDACLPLRRDLFLPRSAGQEPLKTHPPSNEFLPVVPAMPATGRLGSS